MKLADLVQILEEIAPTKYAEAWDNVGLLAGDRAAKISGIMLTIDCTAAVLREAKSRRCDLIVAYHPPIFETLKRLAAGDAVFDAIRAGIAIYSPHTALDVADGGTNDMLADVLGMTDRAALRPHAGSVTQYKLVTFVPTAHISRVGEAIFAAGAGRIGNYSSCSFRSPGVGTFFGEKGTDPAVGKSGRLERAAEVRLETVVQAGDVAEVIRALRQAHPYEEPAFDLNQLAALPTGRGMGRIGSIKPVARKALLRRIKRGLDVNQLLVSGPTIGLARRVAVCAGSGGNLLNDAVAAGADLFLTGEVRHHDALKAAAAGMTVICALHSNSERPVLARLKSRLQSATKLSVRISASDRDPFLIL